MNYFIKYFILTAKSLYDNITVKSLHLRIDKRDGVLGMEYRQLGRTGLKVSVVGLGGIPLQRVDFPQAAAVVEAALKMGLNFIDTARGYTDSEAKLGEVLGRNRGNTIIATKTTARSGEDMAAEVEKSLESLQVDYIDLYQLHNVKDEGALERVLAADGALAALKEAREQGKVKFIGITGHIPAILVRAIKTGEFDTVQFPCNPLETTCLDELLPLAQSMNLGTIAMKPFAGGAIKDKMAALRFIIEHGFSTVIPGMEQISQVEENLAAGINVRPLSASEKEALEKERESMGSAFCRRCEYCLPCPQGIDIPTMFLLDGYCARYGLRDWAVERYSPIKVKASDCLECGRCEDKCPYQLPIREMLKDVARHLE